MTTKQKVHIDRTPQFDIFAPITQSEVESKPVNPSHSSQRCFISPDAETIYLGNTSLKNYLWVSGGIFPDHANIGRFINRHAEQLTGSFFESIVKTVLRTTHSKGNRLAGDGTVVEAACSHYHLIREEAVKTALEEAQQQCISHLRSQCTTSKTGRRIRRFKVDNARDALKTVMEHPAAKAVFKKRQAMVEPVFGYLRTVQGLNRFRRRGLKAVRLEFSLHLLAYNLSRVAAAYFTAILWPIGRSIRALGLYTKNNVATLQIYNDGSITK